MLWLAYVVWNRSAIATVCVCLSALLGDYVVAIEALSQDLRAVADNATHGIIGLLTWYIVTNKVTNMSVASRFWEIMGCGLIASGIDLDHFAAAKSFKIEAARQLSARPLLHCTSLVMAGCSFILLLTHVLCWPYLQRVAWILTAAVLSHHLRDATRRGFWLYPFGSSPPVPYVGYILGCMLLPHVLPFLVCYTEITESTPSRNMVMTL